MIRWITDHLGTAPFEKVKQDNLLQVVDVRNLIDDSGNSVEAVREKIEEAASFIASGKRVAVCCDLGISRSNAIAAGVLAVTGELSFNDAVRKTLRATDEKSIKIPILATVREAVNEIKNLSRVSRNDQQKILITGSGGFLGSALLRRLQNEYLILAPSKEEMNLVDDGVKLDMFVRENSITHIIHLANPLEINTNRGFGYAVTMLRNILDVCQANILKLVYLSCFQIYSGNRGSTVLVNESSPRTPLGSNGELKCISERLIDYASVINGLEYTIIRSGLVYGGDGTKPSFISNFLNKSLRGEDIVTHKYINGYPELDLLHIDDFCSAIKAVLKGGNTGYFNIGSGKLVSTKKIAQIIIELTRSKCRVRHNRINKHYASIIMDSRRANDQLMWSPKVDYNEGLKKLIAELGD